MNHQLIGVCHELTNFVLTLLDMLVNLMDVHFEQTPANIKGIYHRLSFSFEFLKYHTQVVCLGFLNGQLFGQVDRGLKTRDDEGNLRYM